MRRPCWLLSLLALLAFVRPVHAETVQANMLLLAADRIGEFVVAVGERGTIIRSNDWGRTWQSVPSGTFATLTAIAFESTDNNPRHGWAVGHDATILATDDGGATWHKAWHSENLELSFLSVCPLSERHVIAVGAYGLFLETVDGGKTWNQRKILADDLHLNRITARDLDELYIAGEHGTLLRSTDAGQNWTSLTTPYEGSFYGILAFPAHTLLAYGLRGHVYRSTDNGKTWTAIATPLPTLIATATPLIPADIIFAGQARGLYISHDGGQTITALKTSLTTAVSEVINAHDGTIIAFGEAGATRVTLP